MDKNTVTGIALMAVVFFLFMWLSKPSDKDKAQQNTKQEQVAANSQDNSSKEVAPSIIDSTEAMGFVAEVKRMNNRDANGAFTVETPMVNASVDSANVISGTLKVGNTDVALEKIVYNKTEGMTPEFVASARKELRDAFTNIGKYQSFAKFMGGEEKTITLENDLVRLVLSSKGGKIQSATLKNYKTEVGNKGDVCLFNATNGGYSFAMQTTSNHIDTDDFNFVIDSIDKNTVLMNLELGEGVQWGIKYTLLPGEYLVRMDIQQKGMDQIMPANTTTIGFNWHQKMRRFEQGRTFEERNSAIYYKYTGESPDDMDENGDDSEELKGQIKWVAFKNQFFSSVIIAKTNFSYANLESKDLKANKNGYLKDMNMKSSFSYNISDPNPASFFFYLGPNDYPLLSDLDNKLNVGEDLDLNRLVPLGWGLFRWINQLIIIPVFTFLSKFISNYGIIILLLTIFIKILLFPFTRKSYISQAKMRVLAPEIKEINEKYPGQENAMRRQQETMALYSRAGASPFSGCLPMLLQMPVLIAMFSFFPSAIELRGQSFLWAHDLSAPDYICELPFKIPFYGDHVSLFCLLMTVTNIIYTRINMQNQAGGNNMPGMKWMMYLMPVLFLFFFNDYASGLSYYYFLSLLITIVQTYVFRKMTDENKVRQQMLDNAKKPRKKSGFMARLEEAQKRQQAMLREQAKQNAKRRR